MTSPLPSIARPRTSNTRPSVTSPTGTEIAAPVSRTAVPRARPSVVVMATARTQLLPRCCCTSHTSGTSPSRMISTALKIAGSCPAGNSMSTTGPVIWMTRPVAEGAAVAMVGSASWVRPAYRAWAPLAISTISRVMLAWRTLLYESVRSSMSSWAFSVAFFIATIRDDSSLAFDSSTAWYRRVAT